MQKIGNAVLPTAKRNKNLVSCKTKRLAALALLFICSTGYALADAGSSAITQTVGTFKGYIDPVRNLLYVLAAIVSLVGAFNCYYKLQNGDQDVKNILVLKNWLKTIRKEMKQKFLCISHLQGYFAFPIFENMTLKKI